MTVLTCTAHLVIPFERCRTNPARRTISTVFHTGVTRYRFGKSEPTIALSGGRISMTVKVDAECWCQSVVAPDSARNQPARCGDVAISLCEGCGIPMCESHEIVCSQCLGVTCLNCDHTCKRDAYDLEVRAA